MRGLYLLIPVAFVVSTLLTGFGSPAPGCEERPVSDFTRVDLGGHGDLTIIQGDTESLTVEAEPRIIDRIKTDVRGGTLYIRIELGFWDWWRTLGATPPRYVVTMKQINGVELSGSGQIRATGVTADTLNLGLGGSGQVTLADVAARSINGTLSGSGRFSLTGQATAQDFKLLGSGRYDARGLETKSTSVQVSGSGEVLVWAAETLTVEILGSGSVRYRGDPKVTHRILGSGSIEKM